jgi:hypothetical protein
VPPDRASAVEYLFGGASADNTGVNMPDHAEVEFWLKVLGVVGALVALTLTWRAHAERTTFEMIERLYALWYSLQSEACRDWYLAHLLCIGTEEYDRVTNRIRQQLGQDTGKQGEYLIKERLFVIHILMIYEQVYYQWRHSSLVFHRRRRRFLAEVLSYFTGRLLQNPRLLHFLQADETGTSLHLEQCSRKYLDRALGQSGEPGMNLIVDHRGPLAQNQD